MTDYSAALHDRPSDFADEASFLDAPSFYQSFGKRTLDVALIVMALPILLLIFPILWAAVKVDGGPAFFLHRRIGRNGKPFNCIKFRTMVPDAEARLTEYLLANPEAAVEWGTTYKLRRDPRITSFGRLARRTSFDELPQLWNVLRGEMTLVGPRPVVEAELAYYGKALPLYLALRPGLTGLWQVSGRNDVSYDRRVLMDCEYKKNMSLGFDALILLRTILVVFKMTGR